MVRSRCCGSGFDCASVVSGHAMPKSRTASKRWRRDEGMDVLRKTVTVLRINGADTGASGCDASCNQSHRQIETGIRAMNSISLRSTGRPYVVELTIYVGVAEGARNPGSGRCRLGRRKTNGPALAVETLMRKVTLFVIASVFLEMQAREGSEIRWSAMAGLRLGMQPTRTWRGVSPSFVRSHVPVICTDRDLPARILEEKSI